jgi:ABC-type amino acid transport substrate-binding protein
MGVSEAVNRRSMLDLVLERGMVRIPVVWWDPPDLGPPPEFFLDPVSGRPSGVIPELGRILADELGVELELVEVPWHEHMHAVLSGRVDLLLSYTNLPERALHLDFAGPLLTDEVMALVRHSDVGLPLTDFDDPRRSVGVSRGSSVRAIAERRLPNATIVDLDDPIEGLDAGVVDLVVEAAITKALLRRHPELGTIRSDDGRSTVLGMEYGHPAIPRGDERSLNWLRNWLDYHRAQGTIDQWCGTYWMSWMAD